MNIVITGASRGIGAATAKQLATDGNRLLLVAHSKESFKEPLPNAALFAADLTSQEDISRLAEELAAATPSVDVLVNVAGVMTLKRFEQMSPGEINQLIDLNLRAYILLTHALLPMLHKSSRPQIIFMSSMAAKSSVIGESVYAATKSGVTNFANVLRNELSPEVRVSTVHAWGVNTWDAANPEQLAKPSDVAAAMEFIISRPDSAVVESIELGNPAQWRGGEAPWSPRK